MQLVVDIEYFIVITIYLIYCTSYYVATMYSFEGNSAVPTLQI